jgi:protein transport protein SEC23
VGSPTAMDYESLKEQWSDIEDRDGVRLSWNTFPSSRMVCASRFRPWEDAHTVSYRKQTDSLVWKRSTLCIAQLLTRSSAHRSPLHALEGED